MSVRRLAEDAVQPARFAFTDENSAWAEKTIDRFPEGRQQSAVIPLLMRAQEQEGWVTKAAIEHVADKLRMPLIRVLEVATFYTQFQLKPVGTRAHVQVCGTTPCMLRGSDALKEVCRKKIHHDQFHTNDDGTLSWEEVECLGACVNAPMVMIFKDTYEDLTPERLEEIIDAFARGEGPSVPAGPQIDRHLSAPIGGPTTLLSEEGSQGTQAGADSGPAAEGAPHQGSGSGGAVGPESQAARPDTHAPETDASMSAPGKATNGNVPQQVEASHKIDVAEGADRPGNGETGGTQQGPTGALDKDKDALDRGSASKDADTVRRDGPLGAKGQADDEAVVQDHKKVDPVDHASDHGVPAGDAHRAGKSSDGLPDAPEGTRAAEDIAPPVEAKRVTDDVVPAGPAASDVLETNAEAEAQKREASPAVEGTLETSGPKPIGQKPAGLLEQPDGEKDDLKAIRGIGPVIEKTLNEIGVFHFRQIAAWSVEELVWVDDHINFHGRALRDRWIEQAKDLAAGRSGERG
ncbi:NADH-quinone oxidoreductase subunit NuoE [Aureimonas leprariae]|uniref:NADH-quinone oxidoreductase subunit NuoE n=1 Tax=Plantimonas leprariae TaxID=2615207 RepID=A0A7V7PSC5_9HYPH|nr:NADH-quinone oxidoreductase subunit NuoE [Aureimonas leprariae]